MVTDDVPAMPNPAEEGDTGVDSGMVPNTDLRTTERDMLLQRLNVDPTERAAEAPPASPTAEHAAEHAAEPPAAGQASPEQWSMPALNNNPINERDDITLFRKVFPTLFPYGKADFNNPRDDDMDFGQWIKHLLRFKDGRFAQHKRFPYVAYNMMLRQRAEAGARWSIRGLSPGVATMSKEELRDMLAQEGDNHQWVNKIGRSASKISGTRPFWGAKRRELKTLVKSLGCPALFFTVSAADVQWHDLHVQFPDFVQWCNDQTGDEGQRCRMNQRNLNDNPAVTAEHLYQRFKLFYRHVLCKILPVSDCWYRYEWQARGSGHIHGFLWLNEYEPPSTSTEDAQKKISDYWGPKISAINSNKSVLRCVQNPSSIPFERQENTIERLNQVLNSCQRHDQCRPSYCQVRD